MPIATAPIANTGEAKKRTSKPRSNISTPKNVAVKLEKGETIRKDGTLMYRVPKSDFDWDEPIPPVYAKTLPELREKKAALLNKLNKRLNAQYSKATVDDVYLLWKDAKAGLVRNNTLNNYCYMYDHFIRRTKFGKIRAVSVHKSDVMAFYNSLANQGVKPHTMETLQNVLHQMFEILVEDNYIVANPADGALTNLKKATTLGKSHRSALTIPEQWRLLQFLKSDAKYDYWRILLIFMLGTGLRIGEVAALRWDDIDFEKRTIRISHSLVLFAHPGQKPSCTFEMHDPKTPAGFRIIPMMDFVYDVLMERKRYVDESGDKSETVCGFDNLIFFNRFCQAIHQGTVNKAIRRIIRDCNEDALLNAKGKKEPILLPAFSCHTLRHTCVSMLIHCNINPNVVKEYMGHASLETTIDIYTDVMKEAMQRSFGLQIDQDMKKMEQENLFVNALKNVPDQFRGSSRAYVQNYREGGSELAQFTQFYTADTQNDG